MSVAPRWAAGPPYAQVGRPAKQAATALAAALVLLVGIEPAAALDIDGGVRLFGADGLPLPPFISDRDTILHLHGGGGWQSAAWYRDVDGTAQPGLGDVPSARLQNANGELLSWLEQGVAPGLALFAGPRLTYEAYFADPDGQVEPTLRRSSRVDAFENLQLSYVVGTDYDTLQVDDTGVLRAGWVAAATLEHAPAALNQVIGGADFARGSINATYYLPLVSNHRFRVYLAQRAIVDLIGGNGVPALAQGRIGGIRPQTGLGGAFRGLPGGRLDAPLKTLLSADLRGSWLTGFANDWFIPDALAYVDFGTASALDAPLSGANAFDQVVLGSGAGVSMRVRLIPFLPFDLVLLGSFVFDLSTANAGALPPTLGLHFAHQF